MSDYALTALAKTDIFDIWSYIEQHNQNAADRVEQAILRCLRLSCRGPFTRSPSARLDIAPVRFWTLARYPNYTIVYLPENAPLQIIAALHGKRNIPRILKQRP